MKLSSEKMRAEKDGAIGWMTFDNPARHNALSLDMWAAIPEILDEFEADDEIRVIVLRGAGDKAFISGADISEFEKSRSSEDAIARYDEVAEGATQRLKNAAKPTIAMIKGYCIGGGLAVAISCDLRISAEDGRFAVPAAKLGVAYRVGSLQSLMELVGPAFTKEIVLTARQFDASEAHHMGLINRVLPTGGLEAGVRELGERIANNAPLTLRNSKRMVAELLKPGGPDQARCEALVKECFASADYIEGRRAFMEKRKPRFEGR